MESEVLNSILVMDIETTGPDVFENDATYLHVAPLAQAQPTLDLYLKYPEHELNWSSVASRYFKTYKERWEENAVDANIAWENFCDFILSYPSQKVIFAGHNIAFDYYFLKKLAKINNASLPDKISHRLYDSHSLLLYLYLSKRIPKKALTLTGAINYFRISDTLLERHSAKWDVEITKAIFEKCLELANS